MDSYDKSAVDFIYVNDVLCGLGDVKVVKLNS